MAFRPPGKREPCINILKGNDVSAATVYKPLHGIQGHEMTRILGLEIPWFSQDFLAIRLFHSPVVINLLRECPQSSEVLNEIANGA